MGWPHEAFVVDGDVHEELVDRDVLLGEGPDQIMERQARDRQNRLPVELRVVEAIQQVNPAGA